MNKIEKVYFYRQLMWDYNISGEDIADVFSGVKEKVGHYNRESLFRKMLESYSWFTLLQIFEASEIKTLLTSEVINKLRTPSLREKYAFVQKRLQEIIPYSR